MKADIIVVGASLGGLRAVETILAQIPQDFQVPIVIAQHRRVDADERLVGLLQKHTSLKIHEAEDKEEILPENVYLAPTDYHLLIEPGSFALSTEPPVCHARPSIDVLFESAADCYRNRALGVVLTGKGCDGAEGATRIRRAGGTIIVQCPESAESQDMPSGGLISGEKMKMVSGDIYPFDEGGTAEADDGPLHIAELKLRLILGYLGEGRIGLALRGNAPGLHILKISAYRRRFQVSCRLRDQSGVTE